MCQTGSASACADAPSVVRGRHTAVISECSPLRWNATLDGQPIDGVFNTVEEAAGAVTTAMRDRHALIPADQHAQAAARGSERPGGEQ
jgi:hypothetical protein